MKLIIDVIKILVQETLIHININPDQRHFLLNQIREILPQLDETIAFSSNETSIYEYKQGISFKNLKLSEDIIKQLFPKKAFEIRSLYRLYFDNDPEKVRVYFKDNKLNDEHNSIFYQAIKDLREAIRITMNIEQEKSLLTVNHYDNHRYHFYEKKSSKPAIGPIIGWTINGLK